MGDEGNDSFGLSRWDFVKIAVGGVCATALSLFPNKEATALSGAGGSNGQVQYNNNGEFAGASNLYYDSSNNRVGIGTTSPSALLHVEPPVSGKTVQFGNIYIDAVDKNQIKNDSYGLALNATTGIMNFYTANTLRMHISATGNVGIGTQNPTHLLDVNGSVQMLGMCMPSGAGVGKVLTSNSNGVASWQAVAPRLWNDSGNYYYPNNWIDYRIYDTGQSLKIRQSSNNERNFTLTVLKNDSSYMGNDALYDSAFHPEVWANIYSYYKVSEITPDATFRFNRAIHGEMDVYDSIGTDSYDINTYPENVAIQGSVQGYVDQCLMWGMVATVQTVNPIRPTLAIGFEVSMNNYSHPSAGAYLINAFNNGPSHIDAGLTLGAAEAGKIVNGILIGSNTIAASTVNGNSCGMLCNGGTNIANSPSAGVKLFGYFDGGFYTYNATLNGGNALLMNQNQAITWFDGSTYRYLHIQGAHLYFNDGNTDYLVV